LRERGVTLAIHTPQRAYSGDLDTEIAALEPLCEDALVVGVSGGATLALELAARGVPFAAAIVHEPAVGSLLPGLLAPMVAAYQDGGVDSFATTLYGAQWRPQMAPPDRDAVGRDLAMFRCFEPHGAAPGAGDVLVTVGEHSPAIRYEAAEALTREFGYPVTVLSGSGHAAHLEAARELADLICDTLTARI
jgi:pimeloyl-ACP methyl ester carboxylesterase